MTSLEELYPFFNALLMPERFKDFCPNGLQVEGTRVIKKIVSGVTASQALIDSAIAANANAIFVHHGLFWRGETRITGWMRQRVGALIAHDVNLFAYHLPLDAHPSLGNNAQLGRVLGFEPIGRFGDQDIGWLGTATTQSFQVLCERVKTQLRRDITAIGENEKQIKRVAWCSGGAQNYFEAAIDAGVDVFITGEISEPQAHYAREMGVAYIACGHHVSERYGASAVAQYAAEHFGLQHEFIDIDNPA